MKTFLSGVAAGFMGGMFALAGVHWQAAVGVVVYVIPTRILYKD